jgi:CheY-like chemotaxis protein
MRVLWVAPPSESRSLHVKALEDRPGYSVRAASSYAEAARIVLAQKTAIDVIVMEMEKRSEDAVDFVREMRELSIYEMFRCPHFLILALGKLSDSLFDRFVALKARL